MKYENTYIVSIELYINSLYLFQSYLITYVYIAGMMRPIPNPNRKLGLKNTYGQGQLESLGSNQHTQGSSGSLTPTPTTPSTTRHDGGAAGGKPKKLMGGRIGGAKMDKKLTKSFYKEDGSQQQ